MNELIRFIPEYTPKNVVSMLSEPENWGIKYTNIQKYIDITKSKGENIKVVVLDTGSNKTHRDLAVNFKADYDFTGNNDPEDRVGHSSAVQGIIAGIDNQEGVIGVAPQSGLYVGKVLNDQGFCPPDYNWIIEGLKWAIDINADIVNLSLGAPIVPPDKLQEIVRVAASKGIILIAASGNEQLQLVDYPGRYDEVISVAAMDRNGRLASYSNIGPSLDFIAPGTDIYSTYLNNGYVTISGTSFASPFVAGVTALLLSYHRNGSEHKTLIRDYNDVISHIKRFEKGRLIDFGDGKGVGILDFGNIDQNEISMCSVEAKNIPNDIDQWKNLTYKILLNNFDLLLKKILKRDNYG